MEKVVIISGKFTDGADKKGNFSAKLMNGKQIFIHQNTMLAAGITKENFKPEEMPFFGYATNVEIGMPDPDNEGQFIPNPKPRYEVTAVFKTSKALAAVEVAQEQLNMEIALAKKEVRTAAGLTDEELKDLLAASW